MPSGLCRSVLLLLLLIVAAPVVADDAGRCAELHGASEPMIPLRNALGEMAFVEAIDSGDYSFAGNAKCRLCHRNFFLGRKKDSHDHTFRRLADSGYGDNERCLGCHTTGYGVTGGFVSVSETPRLLNVQCEGCHGPGSEHIRRNAAGGFLAGTDRPEVLRKMCLSCHDPGWDRAIDDFEAAYASYRSPEPGYDDGDAL